MVKAIFFDRDGVLCDLVARPTGQHTAPWTRDEFKMRPYIAEALALTRAEYKHFVVTNQPDVLDGKLAFDDLLYFHECLYEIGHFDEIVYCLDRHSPNYKPRTGMVDDLVEKYNIDITQSFLVGDRWKDIVCGHHAGLTTIFVGAKYEDGGSGIGPDYSVTDVKAACDWIMQRTTERMEAKYD